MGFSVASEKRNKGHTIVFNIETYNPSILFKVSALSKSLFFAPGEKHLNCANKQQYPKCICFAGLRLLLVTN
jgi:hypothetical protein